MSTTQLSAVDLAAALQSREVSAKMVMQDYLQRIAQVNPTVNAIISQVDDATALANAEAADARLAEGNAPPLTGFPLAVKDLADVAGFKTSYGSPLLGHRPARQDSLLASRLRAAGGVFIGKTNVPEFGFGSHTFNPVHGTTLNPYDSTRSAGGSSGGGACALACNMLPVADGSDFGGSLRNPASFCSVVGMRPSVGRVADVPQFGWAARIGVQGPMARTTADLALLMSVLAGSDPRDPLSFATPDGEFTGDLRKDFSGCRIAWTRDFAAYPVAPEVADVCERALASFASMGCTVDSAHPDVSDAMDVFQTQRAAAMRALGNTLERQYPDWRSKTKDTAIWNFEKGFDLTFEEFHASEIKRTAILHRFTQFFTDWDFLVLPTVQVLPFPADEEWVREINGQQMPTYLDWMSSCCVISITDLPALSLPVGFSHDGLPVGLQIVGPPKSDNAVIQLAHALEQALDLPRRPIEKDQSS